MSDQSEDVGFKKPPTSTQFKKGKSGNPKGRPRGTTREAGLSKVLGRTVTVTMDGKNVRVPVDEALALTLAQVGLKGNDRVALRLIKLGMEALAQKTSELSQQPISEVSEAETLGRQGGLYFAVDMLCICEALRIIGFFTLDEDFRYKVSKKSFESLKVDRTAILDDPFLAQFVDDHLEGRTVPSQLEQRAASRQFVMGNREFAEKHYAELKSASFSSRFPEESKITKLPEII